jgi:hypothetical protein
MFPIFFIGLPDLALSRTTIMLHRGNSTYSRGHFRERPMDFVVLSVVACTALLLLELYDDLSGDWIDRGEARMASVELPAGAWLEAAPGSLAIDQSSAREAFQQAA